MLAASSEVGEIWDTRSDTWVATDALGGSCRVTPLIPGIINAPMSIPHERKNRLTGLSGYHHRSVDD